MSGRRPILRVVAGVARRGERVLVAKRGEGAHAGRWEFPGGKVEPGESDAEALAREIREELGAGASIGAEIDAGRYAYRKKTVDLHFLAVLSLDREPSAIGAAEIRWVDPRETPSMNFLEGDRVFLQRIADPAFLGRYFP